MHLYHSYNNILKTKLNLNTLKYKLITFQNLTIKLGTQHQAINKSMLYSCYSCFK